ncbi:MAG: sn-glycerol-1-phosphate dehydrogenase [Candidatus Dormibacteraeota bacterium]|nr:sn-glycerol-1-phosphate dehydrogenase [Candidatus Dormibacteraeota bacterium]
MAYERIKAALQSAADTEQVLIGAGVLSSVEDVFRQSFGEQPAQVVADENTFRVAGEQVRRELASAGRRVAEPYVFPGRPILYADYGNVELLRDTLRGQPGIAVAVGSGSLNDIVKRASFECDRRYMAVATAASMDGYTAFGAAITRGGYKQTMTCPAPRAVLADLDLLRTAPPEMTASGYADLLGKVTAGADWIIADSLGVEMINQPVWSMVQDPLREAIGRPAELQAGDQAAMDSLIEGLIMSGLAMQSAASSRPASGAEHQFSHLWEMEGLGHDSQPPLSHGFKVGLGSIAIAALYERILSRDLQHLDIPALCRAWPTADELERSVRAAHQTPGLTEAAVKESLAKYVGADELAVRLDLLQERWPELRERLEAHLLTADQLRQMLLAAGCPVHPSEVGLRLEAFRETYYRARMIRRRYTLLDLATETGVLAQCVDELFARGGFWTRGPAAQV